MRVSDCIPDCVCVLQVLESCEGKRPEEVTIEVSHDVASTDTDSGMSGERAARDTSPHHFTIPHFPLTLPLS